MLVNYLIGVLTATKYLLELRKTQWKDVKELEKIQLKKLKKIVDYAYNYIPHYNQIFKKANFKPQDIKSLVDIKKLPSVSKSDIRNNSSEFMRKGVDKSKYIEYKTSGSTGAPLKTYKNLSGYSIDTALKAYNHLECGMGLTDKFVSIHFHTFTSKILPTQIFVNSNRKTSKILNDLRKINPENILVDPITLEGICSHDLTGINPKLIFSRSVNLTEHCRELVRSTFGLEVHDTYGSTEIGRVAFECNEHSGLHLITDSTVLEFIDDDGEPVAPGEAGEIYATCLYNYAMPLIRYKIGDIGIQSNEKCNCGRGWPLIKSIEGRKIDVIITPSGKRIYPGEIFACLFEGLKDNFLCLSRYQVIQESRERLSINLVKGLDFKQSVVKKIKTNFENLFSGMGEEVSVETRVTDKIFTEKEEKRKPLISRVSNDKM